MCLFLILFFEYPALEQDVKKMFSRSVLPPRMFGCHLTVGVIVILGLEFSFRTSFHGEKQRNF